MSEKYVLVYINNPSELVDLIEHDYPLDVPLGSNWQWMPIAQGKTLMENLLNDGFMKGHLHNPYKT